MKKLLLATEDFIVVTPELYNDLTNVKVDVPYPQNPYVVELARFDASPFATLFGVEIKVVDYATWTKHDGVTQDKLKLEVNSKVYEAEERFKRLQKIENRILKQLQKWNEFNK